MGKEEIGQGEPETLRQPVEVAFWDVVRFIRESGFTHQRYVVIDTESETSVLASAILNDEEGRQSLALSGTQYLPLEKTDEQWPLEKIIDAIVKNYDKNGKELPGVRESWTEQLTPASQKPPVMYRGGE